MIARHVQEEPLDESSNGARRGACSPEAESYPDVSYAVCSASAAAAITSISTLAPLGNAETWTVERAGGSCLKYDPYISFIV